MTTKKKRKKNHPCVHKYSIYVQFTMMFTYVFTYVYVYVLFFMHIHCVFVFMNKLISMNLLIQSDLVFIEYYAF